MDATALTLAPPRLRAVDTTSTATMDRNRTEPPQWPLRVTEFWIRWALDEHAFQTASAAAAAAAAAATGAAAAAAAAAAEGAARTAEGGDNYEAGSDSSTSGSASAPE